MRFKSGFSLYGSIKDLFINTNLKSADYSEYILWLNNNNNPFIRQHILR